MQEITEQSSSELIIEIGQILDKVEDYENVTITIVKIKKEYDRIDWKAIIIIQ